MDGETLALAYAIAEFDSAITHLVAVRSVGVEVPYNLTGKVERELAELCLLWAMRNSEPTFSKDDTPRIVSEARTYLTAHLTEIDELLSSEREGV